MHVAVRRMRSDEWDTARSVSVDAFDDPHIGELLDALRASWAWEPELSFVALVDDEIVGHVVFTHAILDAPDRLVDVLVLSPLGVRRDRQLGGVGSALVRGALEHVVTRPEPLVFLEGSPRYYPRFGFRPGHELGFTSPSVRIPAAAFQVLPLPAFEPSMRGALVYPDVFWRLDAVGLRE